MVVENHFYINILPSLCYTKPKGLQNMMKKQTGFLKNTRFDFITQSPQRLLPLTFLFMCLLGSVFLFLPFSGHLSFLDAMFTAVSAVCVTGLSVVDVSKDLTNAGQFILLLLIQTGGLGIMSISSIIFIILGKRMSVRYEKNARSLFDAESREEIKNSLFLIFKYTFLLEAVGALILTICFAFAERNLLLALKMGIFTAISAFCNAGFFLKSNNLIAYCHNPLVLYTVSFLIILGGISPAICVMLSRIFKRQKLPPIAAIVFNVTLILLLTGTFVFFVAEYNGVLSGMSFWDKFNNAWFQSVTMRTAGFNSVGLDNIGGVSYILFIILMIIGGSPGGTAGGIKTTAFGVIMITCYNAFVGQNNIIRNKAIKVETLQNSLTLSVLYLGILLLSVLMLITTQEISVKKLVFEAVSAMGTVGVTIGATPLLDEIGKTIIIITMFLGRVAPATIIYYLNTKSTETRISYPDAKISLT